MLICLSTQIAHKTFKYSNSLNTMAKKPTFRAVFLIVAILIAIAAIYMVSTEDITKFGTTGASSSETTDTTPTSTTPIKSASVATPTKVDVKDTLPDSFSIYMYADVTSAGVSRSLKTHMSFNRDEVTSWTRSAVWTYPDGTMKYCDETLNAGTGQFSKTKFEGMSTSESEECYNFLSNIMKDPISKRYVKLAPRDALVTGMALGKIAPKNDCESPSICYEFE